jgi:hypothetical protein
MTICGMSPIDSWGFHKGNKGKRERNSDLPDNSADGTDQRDTRFRG